MSKIDRFFQAVWRFNAIAIALFTILLALGISSEFFLLILSEKNNGHESIYKMNSAESTNTEFQHDRFKILTGYEIAYTPITETCNRSSKSTSDGMEIPTQGIENWGIGYVRNLIFFDLNKKIEKKTIFETNAQSILHMKIINKDKDIKGNSLILLIYKKFDKNFNENSCLSSYSTTAEYNKNKSIDIISMNEFNRINVINGIDDMDGYYINYDQILFIFYKENNFQKILEYDLKSNKIISENKF